MELIMFRINTPRKPIYYSAEMYLYKTNFHINCRDVPDPDSTVRYSVKRRHPALSGIRVKFAGYLPHSAIRLISGNNFLLTGIR